MSTEAVERSMRRITGGKVTAKRVLKKKAMKRR